MKMNAGLLLFLLHAALISGSPLSNCNAKYEYVNLPGIGWDNLVNENRGQILKNSYANCKTTDDGQYLIPDNVFVVPVKSSSVEIFSDIFDHWSNFTSSTARSINVGGSVGIPYIFSIHGSYSSEYQKVKTDQVNDNSFTVRVGARYEKYIAKIQSETSFDDTFRERVSTIANHLLSGREHTARYESQLLVRDFGTHVLTSVNSGAAIYKIEQLNRTATQQNTISRSGIRQSAGISFFGSGVEFNHGSTTSDSTVTSYLNFRTHASVQSHGGSLFKPVNFSINEWVDGIGNNIVAIDRSGDPLNFIVNPTTFPELPLSITERVSSIIEDAVAAYYKYNTIKGCMDMNSPNFNFEANVDDGSCYDAGTNLTFGGVYQTCDYSGDLLNDLCNELKTLNPKTGSASCPEGYESVLLFQGNMSKTEIDQECDNFFIFWKKCHNIPRYGSASYKTYWCAAVKDNVPDDSGYLFGGLYLNIFPNPLSKFHGCPPSYKSLSLTSDLSICLSDDFENGERYSAPFGGLFSCQHGNPLANKYYNTDAPPKMCPSSYSQHLASVVEGCEVNYCAKIKPSEAASTPVKSPPFIRKRQEHRDNSSFVVNNEGTKWTNIYFVPEDFSGFIDDVKGWITNNGKDLNVSGMLTAENYPIKNGNQLSLKRNRFHETPARQTKRPRNMTSFEIGIVATISVFATLLCVMVALFIYRMGKKNGLKTE